MPGCGDSASSPPQPGVYHLEPFTPGLGHALNVEIDPRGAFRWAGNWCDVYWSGGGGQWQANNDRMVWTPIGESKDFPWVFPMFASINDDRLERLEVVGGPRKGELIISGTGQQLGDTVQSWLAGGVCSRGCNTPAAPCDETNIAGPGSCYRNAPPAYCYPDP